MLVHYDEIDSELSLTITCVEFQKSIDAQFFISYKRGESHGKTEKVLCSKEGKCIFNFTIKIPVKIWISQDLGEITKKVIKLELRRYVKHFPYKIAGKLEIDISQYFNLEPTTIRKEFASGRTTKPVFVGVISLKGGYQYSAISKGKRPNQDLIEESDENFDSSTSGLNSKNKTKVSLTRKRSGSRVFKPSLEPSASEIIDTNKKPLMFTPHEGGRLRSTTMLPSIPRGLPTDTILAQEGNFATLQPKAGASKNDTSSLNTLPSGSRSSLGLPSPLKKVDLDLTVKGKNPSIDELEKNPNEKKHHSKEEDSEHPDGKSRSKKRQRKHSLDTDEDLSKPHKSKKNSKSKHHKKSSHKTKKNKLDEKENNQNITGNYQNQNGNHPESLSGTDPSTSNENHSNDQLKDENHSELFPGTARLTFQDQKKDANQSGSPSTRTETSSNHQEEGGQSQSSDDESYYSYSASEDDEMKEYESNEPKNPQVSKIVYHVLQLPKSYNEDSSIPIREDVLTREVTLDNESPIQPIRPSGESNSCTLYLVIALLFSILIFIIFRKK